LGRGSGLWTTSFQEAMGEMDKGKSESPVVGVDVGGTKIAAGVVDAAGRITGQVKIPTDTSQATTILDSIERAVRTSLAAAGLELSQIKGVGLGIPGVVDPLEGVGIESANLGWRNVPVKARLEKRLGVTCYIENDVGAGALGESLYGAGRGFEDMVYLSLGTGVAARAIISGKLYRGTHGVAGEIGHISLVGGAKVCRCGGQGCLEAWASGPAIAAQAQEAVQAGRSSLLPGLVRDTGEIRAETVFEAASGGDRVANEIVGEAGRNLAHAIFMLAALYDPQAVVLGGGLVQGRDELVKAIRAGMEYQAKQSPLFLPVVEAMPVRVSELKNEGPVLGAAAIFNSRKQG
jgi:glucokinase